MSVVLTREDVNKIALTPLAHLTVVVMRDMNLTGTAVAVHVS